MTARISAEELRALRNDVEIHAVVALLGIPQRGHHHRRRFRCPRCSGFDMALAERHNLARCFRCRRSFNPIDLVMAERGSSFLAAVRFLHSRR